MPEKPTDPIQEQLIAARRNQILDAATAVFAEKGFHRATIRDVAKFAGIADGTIYIYFENKTALLMGILNRLNESEHREDDMAQSLTMDMREFMQTYTRQRLDALAAGGAEVMQVVLSEILVNADLRETYFQQIVAPTYATAEKYFQEWVEKGGIQPVDTQLAMRVIAGMVLGVMMLRILGDPTLQEKWDELPDLLTRLVLDGLGGDKS